MPTAWIYLSNSPHIPFFRPIVRRLREEGFDVDFTARDFSQTVALARREFADVAVVGHWGRGTVAKSAAVATRAVGLARHVRRRRRPDVAVSHNSYSQVLAARILRVPAVTLMDYEHQPANHLAFRLARLVVVPEVFPEAALRRFGARRVRRYPGLKEEVYLHDAPAGTDVRAELGVGERPLVVLRPPPDFAAYHRFENPLFAQAVDHLLRADGVVAVLLPRTPDQARWAADRWGTAVVVPERVFPTADLLRAADVLVGAGGTMNREAAVFGVPAYSLFAGEPSAVDAELVRRGDLVLLREPADIRRIVVERRPPSSRSRSGVNPSLEAIVDAIRETAGR